MPPMVPDAGVVQERGQYIPPPGVYIPGDPDGGTCGSLRPLPAAGETYSYQGAPLPRG